MSRFRPQKLRKQMRKAAKSLGLREADVANEQRRRQKKEKRRRYRVRRKQREAHQ